MIKGKDLGQEEKGVTEDELVRWHHWLNGHESEQTLGDSEEQGSLVCTSSWGHKELDTTKWLNNNNMKNPWLTTNQCVCVGGCACAHACVWYYLAFTKANGRLSEWPLWQEPWSTDNRLVPPPWYQICRILDL